MAKEIKLDIELQDSLKDIIKSCEKEDEEIRKMMIRQWQKNESFWHGVQYLFWSQRDESWRSPLDFGFGNEDDAELSDEIGSFSDKVIDIFRGHGESIIAALSAQLPTLRFLPDDADSSEDVLTARTKSKIADLVQRHNKAKFVFLRALFFLAIHGIVASYRYKDSDFSYGSFKVDKYGSKEVEKSVYICGTCGYESDLDWTAGNTGQQQPMEYDNTSTACPKCGSVDPPEVQTTPETVPVVIGTEDMPKSRAKIDVFGPLHFKIAYTARNQSETPYLILFGDQSKDVVSSAFPDFTDEIYEESIDNLDRFSSTEYSRLTTENQNNLVSVLKTWLRPAAFYRERDEKKRKKLLKLFPSGAKVILIGRTRIFVGAYDESLDSRWEIGQAGLSTYIYSDPILRPLVQIQEMRNTLVNLVIETIRHGIASTFADTEVLNFDTYGRYEALPGFVYKVKPRRPGESIGNSFYTTDKATLSREVGEFIKQLDQDAQFSVGSFPSIYGGPSEGNTRTFAEYDASRQMALQRLSIVWNFVTEWWVRTIAGCVDVYVETIIEDEKFVKYENGGYVNVWIRQSELVGKVGGVEPEGASDFPVSLTQKKSLLMKLIELNNDFVNSALYSPQNARILQDVLALNEFHIPGEDQRVKQTLEINELVKSGPLDAMQSSIPIDPDVDDHEVHITTCKTFLVDPIGLDLKKINPEGYANIVTHMKEHEVALMLKTMQAGVTAPGTAPQTADTGVPQ